MQTLRRPLLAPLYYWRTLILVLCVGLFLAEMFRDQIVLMLGTLACAFVFSGYEHRRWLCMTLHFRMGDILLRVILALSVTYSLGQRMIH